MWIICLIKGIIYILRLCWLLIKNKKYLKVVQLFILGTITLLFIMIFSFEVLLNEITDCLYFLIIALEIIGILNLKK